jgi:hypothetical protein
MDPRPITEMNDESLRAVAIMFAELGKDLSAPDSPTPFDAVTQIAVRRLPGAAAASITTYQGGKFSTASATEERARQADAIQYELGSGPCVDAILQETLYKPEDLSLDQRWPEYGKRASQELGWASMLSFRLGDHQVDDDMIAGLNIYSEQSRGFDDDAIEVGLLLATHAASAIAAQIYRNRARNLQQALLTSRQIGEATGVLMTRHHLTREQAFDLLRIASQNTNRKLHDIALEVGDTGTLPRNSIRKSPPAG